MLTIFIFLNIQNATNKLFSTRVDSSTEFVPTENILYPSISVCKRYLADDPDLEEKLDSELSFAEKKKFIVRSIWNLTEVLYFMNHPEMLGLSFPCTSVDGVDPGS